MYTAVNVQALNEKANGVKSLSRHASCVLILSASQTFSINLERSDAETPPEREKQGPEVVCAALSRVT